MGLVHACRAIRSWQTASTSVFGPSLTGPWPLWEVLARPATAVTAQPGMVGTILVLYVLKAAACRSESNCRSGPLPVARLPARPGERTNARSRTSSSHESPGAAQRGQPPMKVHRRPAKLRERQTVNRPQCWIKPPTGTGSTCPVAGRVCAKARPTSTNDDRRRRATSGMGVQTDSAVSPFGSGRSWPPVMLTR